MDASDVRLRMVLSQDFEGREHPILYLSRKLFPRERAYLLLRKKIWLSVPEGVHSLLGSS